MVIITAIPGMAQNPHAVAQVPLEKLVQGGGEESLKWMAEALIQAVERAEKALAEAQRELPKAV
jgi:phage tail protein X